MTARRHRRVYYWTKLTVTGRNTSSGRLFSWEALSALRREKYEPACGKGLPPVDCREPVLSDERTPTPDLTLAPQADQLRRA